MGKVTSSVCPQMKVWAEAWSNALIVCILSNRSLNRATEDYMSRTIWLIDLGCATLSWRQWRLLLSVCCSVVVPLLLSAQCHAAIVLWLCGLTSRGKPRRSWLNTGSGTLVDLCVHTDGWQITEKNTYAYVRHILGYGPRKVLYRGSRTAVAN